jgi:hypothetical protein
VWSDCGLIYALFMPYLCLIYASLLRPPTHARSASQRQSSEVLRVHTRVEREYRENLRAQQHHRSTTRLLPQSSPLCPSARLSSTDREILYSTTEKRSLQQPACPARSLAPLAAATSYHIIIPRNLPCVCRLPSHRIQFLELSSAQPLLRIQAAPRFSEF